jgi:hypothetical protein
MIVHRLRLPVTVERELALVFDRMPAPVPALLYDRAVIIWKPSILHSVLDNFCDSDLPGDLPLSPGLEVDSHSDA